MTAPHAIPPSGLPSAAEVRRVLSALVQRCFSRETHARLLDADVSEGVLTVVAWQAGPSPVVPGPVIGHRTDLGMRLAECEGDLEAVLLDVLQFQVFEPSAPGRAASGAEPAWLLERYPEATWYAQGRAARRGGRSACSRVQAHERSPCRYGWWRCFVLPEMSDRGRSARISGAPPSSAPV
ncbi:hypothetical protein [Micrococcus luteus]|uniref:hypothetical protein n=1 Tax=Micrococcus luteus TaxID=1270 RepID=UPI003018A5B4